MGSARAPLSRKALLQTPLSRTGREGLKLVMTHLGQITTRIATRVATPRTISSNPFTINIRYVDFKLEKLLKKKKKLTFQRNSYCRIEEIFFSKCKIFYSNISIRINHLTRVAKSGAKEESENEIVVV